MRSTLDCSSDTKINPSLRYNADNPLDHTSPDSTNRREAPTHAGSTNDSPNTESPNTESPNPEYSPTPNSTPQTESTRDSDRDHSRPQILGVALDMDGLLFDTERIYWQVGDTVLQRRGHRYSTELQNRMMGRIGLAATQQMIDFHGLDDSPESLLAESDVLYGELLGELLRPMPGLDAWIEHLVTRGVPFALTTSSRRKWVDVIFADIVWKDSLAFTLTGDDVQNGKPHPEMYLTAARQFAIPPQNMLVLEDSGNGCAAAVAAGAHTVAIPNEHTRNQDFSGAKLIADSLSDPRLWSLLDQ